MKATTRLADGDAVHIPGPNFIKGKLLDKLDNTQMGQLATDFGLLPEHGDTKARPRHDDAIAWDDVAGGMPRVAPWHPSRE